MVQTTASAFRKFGLAEIGGFAGLSRELGAGFVAGLSALTNCFAYGALIFSGPLHPFLAKGIAASLMTCFACALVVALTSRFRIAIAAPIANTSALLAVLMLSLAPFMIGLPPDQKLALAYSGLFAATVASGAAMLLVGFIRAGKFVRFFPYPVLAGFMGATGWLVVEGAVKMVTDLPIEFRSLPQFNDPHEALLLTILIGWAVVLWIITKKIKHPLALPVALVLASLAVDLALPTFGISIKTAQAQGILFSISGSGWSGIPGLRGEYFHADWTLLFPAIGAIGAVMLISVLQSLLITTGLELTTRTEIDLDHEVRSIGWANLASAALGGFVGQVSLSSTSINRSAGGTTRLTGVIVSLLALVAMLGASSALEFVPRFVLGGALLIQGIRLVQEWGIATYRTLPRAEWLLVVAMIVITAWLGFIPAEVAGLLAACVLFALSVSRVDIVRAIYGLNARSSSVTWPESETRHLAEHGARVQVVELRGFVFFGSAQHLREKLNGIIGETALLMLIIDFTRVIGIDSSAASAMIRISRVLREKNIQQIVIGMSLETMRVIDESGGLAKDAVILSDIDEALERGERAVIATGAVTSAANLSFSDWLSTILDGPEQAAILQRSLVPKRYKAGDFLCHQGDPTDDLYLIEDGLLCALLEQNVSAPTRVHVFGPRTIVGEIAFVLNVPRTAALRVDEDATVWSLGRAAFGALMMTNPNLALALWQAIVRIQAERLSFATRRIAALN
jgi:SulP family sulfate permease